MAPIQYLVLLEVAKNFLFNCVTVEIVLLYFKHKVIVAAAVRYPGIEQAASHARDFDETIRLVYLPSSWRQLAL